MLRLTVTYVYFVDILRNVFVIDFSDIENQTLSFKYRSECARLQNAKPVKET